MYCEPESDLLQRMQKTGITRKIICRDLKVPFSTLCGWLSGYSTMPKIHRKLIELILDRAEKAAIQK